MTIIIILVVILSALLFILLKKLIHRLFRAVRKKQGAKIHIEFLERISTFLIGMAIIISLLGWQNILYRPVWTIAGLLLPRFGHL